MPDMNEMKLTAGPLLFNWPVDRWRDFYARLADEAPVDRVVIGETVCSKRAPFYEEFIAPTAERLARGGKEVVLSSLALVTLNRERRALADLAANDAYAVEMNDITALRWLEAGRAFSVGPLVNVYNESTLDFLARKGATSVCLPPELPFASVATIAAFARGGGVSIEAWAYGRVPLAISGRCYHARVHKLSKDSCQFVCEQDLDGLDVRTLDGKDFLAINGVQTMSWNYACLIGDIEALARAGVGALRLSPHSGDFVAVAETFRRRLDGALDAPAALERLRTLQPGAEFSDGFLVGPTGAAPLPAA